MESKTNQPPVDLEAEVDKLNYIIFNLTNAKSQMEVNYLVQRHENDQLQKQVDMLTEKLIEQTKGGEGE